MAKEVIYTLKERAYVEQIEKAFNYASKVLLDFLMEEQDLVAHLRCALLPCWCGQMCRRLASTHQQLHLSFYKWAHGQVISSLTA